MRRDNVLGKSDEERFYPPNKPILESLRNEGILGKSCEVSLIPNAKVTSKQELTKKGLIEVRIPERCDLNDNCDL